MPPSIAKSCASKWLWAVHPVSFSFILGSKITWESRINGKHPVNDPNPLTYTDQSQSSAAHSGFWLFSRTWLESKIIANETYEKSKGTFVYIPEHFRVRDNADAISFMRAYPFSILVSSTQEGPFATHLPVVVSETGERLYLRGHVAKANPHWRYLSETPDCLTIFHGPHAYVSPTNYTTREAVPTWNYSAVHAYGKARIFVASDEILSLLHELVSQFEPAYAEQWASLSEVYRLRLLNQIVGFEIAVTTLDAKFKLSQNRTPEEQERIIESLSRVVDTNVSGTACLMQKEGLGIRPNNS